MAAQQKKVSTVPADLAKFGFEDVADEAPHRLLIATQGLERTGKTEFLLSAPGPLGIVSLDPGIEGVAEKWKKHKKVWILNFSIPPITNQKKYQEIWFRVRDAYKALIDNRDVRTIGVDTGSDLWELMRLAEFGQLNPAADIKRAYQPLNQLYRSLIRTAYDDQRKNLIVTHKLKERWGKDNKGQDVWDGTYKRSGFGETGYLIQANIEHFFDRSMTEFGIRVLDCRQNMTLADMEFRGSECNFTSLAMSVFDGTTEKDWK